MRKRNIKLIFLALFFLFMNEKVEAQSGYTVFEKEGKYGLVDSKESVIIPATFEDVKEVSATIYAVKNAKGLWGFYVSEKKMTECLYDNFRLASHKEIIVQRKGRWGLISVEGKELIPFRYRYLNPQNGKGYKAGLFNQWSLRTFEDKVLKVFEFDSLFYLGENVYRFCLAGRYGLSDQEGNIITTTNQNFFESTLSDKLPKKEIKEKVTLIPERTIKIPFEERFDTVYHFSEGFAKFKLNHQYGFVDSLGNIRLVPQYKKARDFSEGMVAVMLMNKWCFMDKNEVLCVQPYYDEVSDFEGGSALVRKGDTYNFVNRKGQFRYQDFFDNVTPTYSGKYILYRNGQYGMADVDGTELVSTKYEAVYEIGNSFIAAKEHGLWGVINTNGIIVIPFNYSVMQYDPEHDYMITMEPGGELIVEPSR